MTCKVATMLALTPRRASDHGICSMLPADRRHPHKLCQLTCRNLMVSTLQRTRVMQSHLIVRLNPQARPDLVNLALRTLEYWVDTLNPEYLEPAMADVMPALMHALWAHLRPPPYPFGPKVLLLRRWHRNLLLARSMAGHVVVASCSEPCGLPDDSVQ